MEHTTSKTQQDSFNAAEREININFLSWNDGRLSASLSWNDDDGVFREVRLEGRTYSWTPNSLRKLADRIEEYYEKKESE
jgi:hypothetical protein